MSHCGVCKGKAGAAIGAIPLCVLCTSNLIGPKRGDEFDQPPEKIPSYDRSSADYHMHGYWSDDSMSEPEEESESLPRSYADDSASDHYDDEDYLNEESDDGDDYEIMIKTKAAASQAKLPGPLLPGAQQYGAEPRQPLEVGPLGIIVRGYPDDLDQYVQVWFNERLIYVPHSVNPRDLVFSYTGVRDMTDKSTYDENEWKFTWKRRYGTRRYEEGGDQNFKDYDSVYVSRPFSVYVRPTGEAWHVTKFLIDNNAVKVFPTDTVLDLKNKVVQWFEDWLTQNQIPRWNLSPSTPLSWPMVDFSVTTPDGYTIDLDMTRGGMATPSILMSGLERNKKMLYVIGVTEGAKINVTMNNIKPLDALSVVQEYNRIADVPQEDE